MKDQVDHLKECGVLAVFLNSSLSADQCRRKVGQIKSNVVKLICLAPEALPPPPGSGSAGPVKIDCIAIDKTHCISEWGHDFRLEYRQLLEVRSAFPGTACMAMTATATPRGREAGTT
jgi:ATP-dependent DNA helicase RecQ